MKRVLTLIIVAVLAVLGMAQTDGAHADVSVGDAAGLLT